MEGKYVRENTTTYVKFNSNGLDKSFENMMKMLIHNKIQGLLPVQERCIDNNFYYLYDITGYCSLSMIYERRDMQPDEVEHLFKCLQLTVKSFEEYFLDEDAIVLVPDYVYADRNGSSFAFVYLPDKEVHYNDSLRRLAEFIMEHMEHSDKMRTVRFYEAYQMILKGECDIVKLMDKLHDTDYKELISCGTEQSESDDEYKIESVMKEPVEDEIEIENSMVTKAAYIIKITAGTVAAVAIISQLLSDRLPINISFSAAIITAGIAAALYIISSWVMRQPGTRWTRLVHEHENETYRISKSELSSEPDIIKAGNVECTRPITENSKLTTADTRTVLLTDYIHKEAELVLAGDDGKYIYIEKFPCIIGSSGESSDVVIAEQYISRMHARVDKEENCYIIQDLFSTNGTYINGRRLEPDERCCIHNGDTVTFALAGYRVEINS